MLGRADDVLSGLRAEGFVRQGFEVAAVPRIKKAVIIASPVKPPPAYNLVLSREKLKP